MTLTDTHGRTVQFHTASDNPATAGSVFLEVHDERGKLLNAIELERASTRAAIAEAFGLVDPLEALLGS